MFDEIFTEVGNLLLNMSAGVLPEHLTKDEVELLEKEYGENWFEKLGYSEPEYKRSVFDNIVKGFNKAIEYERQNKS